MASVKIILENGESEEEAQELLVKALTSQDEGVSHKETFHQPAARDVVDRLMSEYDKMMDSMLREILELIDNEVR
jgi:hypothetical protein